MRSRSWTSTRRPTVTRWSSRAPTCATCGRSPRSPTGSSRRVAENGTVTRNRRRAPILGHGLDFHPPRSNGAAELGRFGELFELRRALAQDALDRGFQHHPAELAEGTERRV